MLLSDLEWNEKDDVLDLAKKVSGMSVSPRIYVAWGDQDFMRESNSRYADEMKKLNLDFIWEEWPGSHSFYFFDEALRKALARF